MKKLVILLSLLSVLRPSLAMITCSKNHESDVNQEFIDEIKKTKKTLIGRIKSIAEVEKLVELIEKGADVNTKDADGCTALIFAIQHNRPDICFLLINNGADKNATKNSSKSTALILATQHRLTDICKLLTEKGANLNLQNSFGRTALLSAVQEHFQYDLITLLIERGADVNAKDEDGYTALMHAIIAGTAEEQAVSKLLIEKGSNINTKDNFENSAFAYAISTGNIETCNLLITNNAYTDLKEEIVKKAFSEGKSNIRNIILSHAIILPEKSDNNIFKTILLLFKRLILSKDIQFCIIVQLPLESLTGSMCCNYINRRPNFKKVLIAKFYDYSTRKTEEMIAKTLDEKENNTRYKNIKNFVEALSDKLPK